MGIGRTTLRKRLAEGTTPEDIIKEEEEPVEKVERKYKSVKQSVMDFAEAKQQLEILKYREQMNFPAEVTKTTSIGSGGGSDANYASMNKGSSYNRSSKRGTRLVRTR